jgi:acid phosphatase (class A)
MRLLGRPPRASSRLHANENALVGPVKRRWCRPCPFAASPAVRPCAPHLWSASYPSWLRRLCLRRGRGSRRGVARVAGRDPSPYRSTRIVCGIHYPSDIEAGRLVGLAIATAARDDPDYRATLVAARLELRHALGLPLQ